MNVEGCWSTVICNAAERAAVGYQGPEWTLQCRLSSGHDGHHATDGDRGAAHIRRRWLEWTDFSEYPHSLLERDPCAVVGRAGEPCQFYQGHGGLHFYAPVASPSIPPVREPAATGLMSTSAPRVSGPSMPSTPSTPSPVPVPPTLAPQATGMHATGLHSATSHSGKYPLGTHASRAMPRRTPTDQAAPGPAPGRPAEYRGGHRSADEPSADAELADKRNSNGHKRIDTIERIDATIRESMELLESEQRSVATPTIAEDISASEAAMISDALLGVATAFERLAQAYQAIGR